MLRGSALPIVRIFVLLALVVQLTSAATYIFNANGPWLGGEWNNPNNTYQSDDYYATTITFNKQFANDIENPPEWIGGNITKAVLNVEWHCDVTDDPLEGINIAYTLDNGTLEHETLKGCTSTSDFISSVNITADRNWTWNNITDLVMTFESVKNRDPDIALWSIDHAYVEVNYTPPYCDDYTGIGDWNVTEELYCHDETIPLNGDLSIKNNGHLIFSNITLNINNSYDGEFDITVDNGGRFGIWNYSLINASNSNFEYMFTVSSGAQLEINNSKIEEAGWRASNKGLMIHSDYANITYSNFTNNYNGIFLNATNGIIENNIIYDNTNNGVVLHSNYNQFNYNNIYSNFNNGIFAYGVSYNVFDNNNINNHSGYGDYGIECDRCSYNNFTNNNISENWYGIYLRYLPSLNNSITGNIIINSNESGIRIAGSNSTYIYNNSFNKDNGDGKVKAITIVAGYYNIIDNNNIQNMGFAGYLSTGGENGTITNNYFENNFRGLWFSRNDYVANNVFNGYNIGIEVSEKSSYFINNTIENMTTAYYGYGSAVNDFVNSTWYNNTNEIILSANAVLTTLNVSFNKTNILTLDTSKLNVTWYFYAQVINSSSNPLDNASVLVYDFQSYPIGSPVYNVSTDPNGYTPTMILVEYVENATYRSYYTPHTVNTSALGYYENSTNVDLKETNSTELTIILNRIPPWWNASWLYRRQINLIENDGINRVNEPIYFNMSVPVGHITNCTNELRVITNYSGSFEEIKVDVLETDDNTWCEFTFLANVKPNFTNDSIWVYYGNANATDPNYGLYIAFDNFNRPNSTDLGGNWTEYTVSPAFCDLLHRPNSDPWGDWKIKNKTLVGEFGSNRGDCYPYINWNVSVIKETSKLRAKVKQDSSEDLSSVATMIVFNNTYGWFNQTLRNKGSRGYYNQDSYSAAARHLKFRNETGQASVLGTSDMWQGVWKNIAINYTSESTDLKTGTTQYSSQSLYDLTHIYPEPLYFQLSVFNNTVTFSIDDFCYASNGEDGCNVHDTPLEAILGVEESYI